MKVVFLVALLIPCVVAQGNCSHSCIVDSDCAPDNDCNQCINKQCLAGCGGTCTGDRDCGDKNCLYCAGGVCQNSPGHQCGQSCKASTDCSQFDGNCQLCLNNTCTAGCGRICDKSSECLGECEHCILGVCAKSSGTCNHICTNSLDCIQHSDCNTCVDGLCGAVCGQGCTQNSDCLSNTCHFCNLNITTMKNTCGQYPINKKCHDQCSVDSQCSGNPGTCERCINRKCGSACSATCVHDTDCVTRHCQKCKAGTCSPS